MSSYNIGDYVLLSKKRKGYIRFDGKISKVGDCYGIELDVRDNKSGHDGSFDGTKYFDVKQGFGIFVKKMRIVSLIKANTKNKEESISPPPISTEITPSNSSSDNNKQTKTNKSQIGRA
eukprot:340003_1